jgi:hypothetical protein
VHVLAHQGGWDETLFVAVPIAIFAGLLWLANRRAAAQLEEDETDDTRQTETTETTETTDEQP